MTTTATSITRNRIIAALIVLALIIAAFIAFMNANLDRIVEQNGRYVEGSTEQTARRLNELFGNAQDNIDTVSREKAARCRLWTDFWKQPESISIIPKNWMGFPTTFMS